MGKAYVEKIRFSSDVNRISSWQQQVSEFKDILQFRTKFPEQDYFDLSSEFIRLKIQGTFIDQETLGQFRASLVTILGIYSYFRSNENEDLIALSELAQNLHFNTQVLAAINQILDQKSDIKDTASSALGDIRRKLYSSKSAVDSTLFRTLREAKNAGWADQEVSPTIRNGRTVIPIPATHKRQVQGFIHDESATGQTVFIEPTAVFELNNNIRELESAEKREIIHILTQFTNTIRPDIDTYQRIYRFLGLFDFIRAKARYAINIECEKPQIVDYPYISLENAHHPILYIHHKKQNKSVVPLNVKLDKEERILVITGPNAGGKTVCLKTVGLIQYMFQCGLLVPASADSRLGIFKDIFVNIGDEQSLENDLSTYSSHLKHLNHFIRKVSHKSMFLIDEFGTGTEPQLGGAIAEAVLEALNKKQAFGIITTHYANLKKLADEHDGMINGAMLFDVKQMKPIFILKTGTPGSSFAFEIAKKIGIPHQVLKRAEKKVDRSQVDFDKQLQQLEVQKRQIEKKSQEIKVADTFLSEMIDKYEKQHEELKKNKNQILREARQEAKDILKGANKAIENTIREIKENKADKVKTKQAREKLEVQKAEIEKKAKEAIPKQKPSKIVDQNFAVGVFVKLKGQETIGEITHLEKNKATIAFESFNFTTTIDQLEVTNPPKGKKNNLKPRFGSIMENINSKAANFSLTLDVRGKKADEVYAITQQYIDEGLLLGINEVEIIHGKGEGILRSVVREVLGAIPSVVSFRDQHADSGGHGVTIVNLR